ncbi:MAG TPA: ABC transporter ATP-binding protein [Miltoncostaeaceae bacterium]|nr:ABC transporter ATP-binding protein [Miltoncostaeaceae bacterium]
MNSEPLPGAVRVRGVARRFRVVHERNATLKETLLRGRRTRYSEIDALRDVSLEIAPGEAVGIVGENGSGKSTLLKILAGIIPPHAGAVEVGGRISSMIELGAGFHPDFTGRENVYMSAAIHGLPRREVDRRLDAIVGFAELEEFIDAPVRTYSSGMQARLGFAVASHVDSNVLLLDEVLAVGDEAFQRKCLGRIFAYRRGGGTVVFVSHDAEAVQQVCDRAILLEDGLVAAEGIPGEVLARYRRGLAGAAGGAAGGPLAAGDEWGNGRVRIAEVRLSGPAGPTESVASGDPFTIEIALEAEAEVPTPVVGIEIRSVTGALCLGTNTRRESYRILSLLGHGTASFHVPSLPLNEGRFTVTVAVHSEDESEVYHWIDRRFGFSVFARGEGVGLVRMDGRWEVRADGGATVLQPAGETGARADA